MRKSLSLIASAVALTLLAALVAAEPPLSLSPQEGVLLLRNGRVLAGRITRDGERFFVALPHGEIRVEAGEVQWSGRNLAECYQHKRSLLPGGNANDHLELAAWCIGNGLFEAAERELAESARLEPRHPKLPLLDRRLKALRSNGPPMSEGVKGSAPPAATKEAAPSFEELEALARELPAGTVESFTGSIQPMLQNHCSTAGCHGPSSASSFRLQRLPHQRLVSPRLTLRNLHAALQAIDRDNPGNSPLLQAPIKPHGTSKEAVFKTRDAAQYRHLVAWVYQAAQAQPPKQDSASEEQPPLLQTDPSPQPHAGGLRTKHKTKPPATAVPRGEPHEPPAQRGTLGLTPAAPSPLGFTPRDPFDPELFNRKHFPTRVRSQESGVRGQEK